jgi:hypothetical protein
MGIFKDAGESLLKYGEIIVNKTEEYTKIAKHTFDIKKLEGDEEKIKIKIGDLVIDKFEKGEKGIDLKDKEISALYDDIIAIREKIKSIKAEIEKEKKGESTKEQADADQTKDQSKE